MIGLAQPDGNDNLFSYLLTELNRATQRNAELHSAYRREVHREVKAKLENDTDYIPDRFPQTRDYFDKTPRK